MRTSSHITAVCVNYRSKYSLALISILIGGILNILLIIYVMKIDNTSNVDIHTYSGKSINSSETISLNNGIAAEVNPDTLNAIDIECNIFVQYLSRPKSSLFINGLFEHYFKLMHFNFSSTKCTQLKNGMIIISKYPFNYNKNITKDTVIMDVGRETCVYRPNTAIIAYNYYDANQYMERKQNGKVYMPLFFRYDTGNFDRDIYPLIINYKEKTKIFDQRQYLLTIIMGLSSGGRSSWKPVFNNISKSFGPQLIYSHLIHKWKEQNMNNDYLNGTIYINKLINAKFNLCIGGNNPETFRIWETLSTATIPILAIKTKHYVDHQCSHSFNPFILHSHNNMFNRSDINIEHTFVENNLVFNRNNLTKWYYYNKSNGFSVFRLKKVYKNKQFSPFILLSDWHDLNSFLKLVYKHRLKNGSIEFWNIFQEYLNEWFKDFIEFKQNELIHAIINNLYNNQKQ